MIGVGKYAPNLGVAAEIAEPSLLNSCAKILIGIYQ